jgi:hypothetical protein
VREKKKGARSYCLPKLAVRQIDVSFLVEKKNEEVSHGIAALIGTAIIADDIVTAVKNCISKINWRNSEFIPFAVVLSMIFIILLL